MTQPFFQRVIVPVASESDAVSTCDAIVPYLEANDQEIVAVHVIEKAGGAPDKASVEQREEAAEKMFGVLHEHLDQYDVTLQTEIRYGTDVAKTIIDSAHDIEASSIAFTPRGGGRWVKLLAGDVATAIINQSDVPIVVLPDRPDDTQS